MRAGAGTAPGACQAAAAAPVWVTRRADSPGQRGRPAAPQRSVPRPGPGPASAPPRPVPSRMRSGAEGGASAWRWVEAEAAGGGLSPWRPRRRGCLRPARSPLSVRGRGRGPLQVRPLASWYRPGPARPRPSRGTGKSGVRSGSCPAVEGLCRWGRSRLRRTPRPRRRAGRPGGCSAGARRLHPAWGLLPSCVCHPHGAAALTGGSRGPPGSLCVQAVRSDE